VKTYTKKLAFCSLKMPLPPKHFLVLEASTKEFVGFFTAYRKDYYKTEFEIIDIGRRL